MPSAVGALQLVHNVSRERLELVAHLEERNTNELVALHVWVFFGAHVVHFNYGIGAMKLEFHPHSNG